MSTRGGSDFNGRGRTRTAQPARPTVRQRGVDATKSLREALHLPNDVNDTAILGTALAEVAAREIRRNQQFGDEVRRTYEDLKAQQASTGKQGTQQEELAPLVPIRRIEGYEADPFSPPDPAFLIQLYGHHQLARALQDYTVDKLKMTAAQIEQRHPGTKPTNRGRRDALIAYIVDYSGKE